jgi:DNA-directed RNA polymerase specialized sigma24 family protein
VRTPSHDEFDDFVAATEPRLHRALVAKLGWERGREATAEALAYAWEYWDRVAAMANPAGYLYRVGASRVRPRKQAALPGQGHEDEIWFEPSLAKCLSTMPERQRIAVVLVHGYGWSSSEVADMTGLKRTTVQTHLERGLANLRRQLKVAGGDRA